MNNLYVRMERALKSENSAAWRIAYLAAKHVKSHLPPSATRAEIVEETKDGAADLAVRCGRSADYFERRALAYQLFLFLYLNDLERYVKRYRSEIEMTKWEEVALEWRRRDLSPADAFELIRYANGRTVEELKTHIYRANGNYIGKLFRKIASGANKVLTALWVELDREDAGPELIRIAKEVTRHVEQIDKLVRELEGVK